MRLLSRLTNTLLPICLLAVLCRSGSAGEAQPSGVSEGQILMITNLPTLPKSLDGYPFVVKDSMIHLPLIAPIKTDGLTHAQLKAKIAEAYRQSQLPGRADIQIRNHR